jgi:TnpA family transposase
MWVKTIFLCQYLHSEVLRREINEGLNVVEHWNGANSFIFYGKNSSIATNRLGECALLQFKLHLLIPTWAVIQIHIQPPN